MTTSTRRNLRADLVQALIGLLDRISMRVGRTPQLAEHLATGKLGEEAALFHLQREGYTVVARNWRHAHLRGDIDLIGWHGGFLCFVEVKTRSHRGNIAAEFAVNQEKRRMLRRMARAYLRRLDDHDHIPVRFDVISVYLLTSGTEFELYQGAFAWR